MMSEIHKIYPLMDRVDAAQLDDLLLWVRHLHYPRNDYETMIYNQITQRIVNASEKAKHEADLNTSIDIMKAMMQCQFRMALMNSIRKKAHIIADIIMAEINNEVTKGPKEPDIMQVPQIDTPKTPDNIISFPGQPNPNKR